MRQREALRLHNRDQVEVRLGPGEWYPAYVLGEPEQLNKKVVIIPVQSSFGGYLKVVHTEIR